MPNAPLEITLAPAATAEVYELVGELEAFLAGLYPDDQRHGLDVEAIFQPHIRFFIARIDGKPVGCGGIALLPGFAEIKRMYVRPSHRGQGIADAIVDRLTEEARAADRTLLRLETGLGLEQAIRFYERCGFRPCTAFEPYTSLPPKSISTSVFYEKPL